ncbi:DUF2589 domain-containing protein [Vibrio spartinae]|uniref:DUF2589 domain-containing protein n=1 Tax=Vibrio spartinae TaxID=1918945 RepID=A0A1N6M1P1_9VIBR|nr:DUF2589 domain-containing protein [Vibrio spartinae]QMV15454.1 hypothetical protein Vspart_02761 [Vibrio spartinae]SIO93322.1 hypothetical protein VSP9026_00981 [Vibrio spartinae]
MAVNSGPGLVSMAQQFSGLPMGDLIGGPLMAAADANNKMAMTQVKFMLDTCFSKQAPKGGGNDDQSQSSEYQPVMVDLTLKRPVITTTKGEKEGESTVSTDTAESSISIPLLTLLPLNALAVDDVSIEFNMEVKSSFSNEQSQQEKENMSAQGSFEAKIGYGPFSASVSGSVSKSSEKSNSNTEKYEKSNKASYDVKVHAGQLPLPEGVGVIIKAYTDNIAPIMVTDSK